MGRTYFGGVEREEERERIGANGARNALINFAYLLQTEKSLRYLARKASVLLEKEQHAIGNTEYMSIYTDPDLD